MASSEKRIEQFKDSMGRIKDVLRDRMYCAYGVARIIVIFYSPALGLLFLLSGVLGKDVSFQLVDIHTLVLLSFVVIRGAREFTERSCYVDSMVGGEIEGTCHIKKPKDLKSVEVSFRIWKYHGLSRHIFYMWTGISFVFLVMSILSVVLSPFGDWEFHVPENFSRTIISVTLTSAFSVVSNTLFFLRIPKYLEEAVKTVKDILGKAIGKAVL